VGECVLRLGLVVSGRLRVVWCCKFNEYFGVLVNFISRGLLLLVLERHPQQPPVQQQAMLACRPSTCVRACGVG
jgi:hypothetical protein